jgi:xanthosine utilization system XapX-like protein
MFQGHYPPLVIAYLVGLSGWLVANRLMPHVWPREPIEGFARPWKEFGIALLGAAGILVMGQMWTRGIRLPEQGAAGAINQVLIFAPIVLVVLLRRQPWVTAWLPRGRVGVRLLVGLGLGAVAVTAYSLLRARSDAPWVLLSRIWRYDHLDEMIQVFLEDLTIAILFVRLAGAVGSRWATVVVACLFAAGHVPAMVSHGATWLEFAGLLRDAGLGVAVILVLQRSRDVVWFWCIHFTLDMTQFTRVSGVS